MPSLFNMDPGDIFRMSPFTLMRRFTEEMDQMLGQIGLGRGQQGGTTGSRTMFAPAVEMSERGGKLIVCVDLPGLSKDDVQVEITDDLLTIEGERRAEREERQEGFWHSERHYGMFRRQIPLPEGIQTEQATATFKDGVLEIALPAPQRQTHGRRIDIQGSTSSGQGQQPSGSMATQNASNTGQYAASDTGTQAPSDKNQEHTQTAG
jgi:HSP20 family protein